MPLFTARRGFELVRRRWVVERTFDWLGRNRRLFKDYEARTDVSEAMIWSRCFACWYGASLTPDYVNTLSGSSKTSR